MTEKNSPYARPFLAYATISTVCLFLSVLSGTLIRLSERMRLLPSYIFFFSFAAFSVMLFQTILTRDPATLPQIKLREQRGILIATLIVSALCVASELTLIPWLKIPAGLLLSLAVAWHSYHIWQGHNLRQIWAHVALRFFITDMFFLLVAAVGLFALGWKETWPDFPLIPGFLRPSIVFLGASFPLTLTFTGYLYRHAQANGGLSSREERIFDIWYYLLVGGVLSFLVVILLDLRAIMQTMALILAGGVFTINALFAGRLARHPRSIGLLFGFLGLSGLLAAATAGNCLIASHTPTIPAGGNPILLSHVHLAQLVWVCISFWGIQYTLWPMMLDLDRGQTSWLPLADGYPPSAFALAILQLVLALSGVVLKITSHLTDNHPLLVISGLFYALATVLPLPILLLLRRSRRPETN